MSLMSEWRYAPVRIVDTSTERDHGATVIEVRLYGIKGGLISDVVARWYPTTVTSARRFLKGFRGEDIWITLDQLEQLLALEGLKDHADEIRMTFTNQLLLTEVQPAARHMKGQSFWGWALVSVALAAFAVWPIAAWAFSH